MSHFEHRIQITSPPEDVFAVLGNPRLMPLYSPLLHAEKMPTGQVKSGDTFRNHFGPAGRGLTLDWHVTECDPPHLLMYAGSGPGDLWFKATNHIMSMGPGSTMLIAEMEYQPPLGRTGRVVDRVLAERFGKREHLEMLRNLKELIEGMRESLRPAA